MILEGFSERNFRLFCNLCGVLFFPILTVVNGRLFRASLNFWKKNDKAKQTKKTEAASCGCDLELSSLCFLSTVDGLSPPHEGSVEDGGELEAQGMHACREKRIRRWKGTKRWENPEETLGNLEKLGFCCLDFRHFCLIAKEQSFFGRFLGFLEASKRCWWRPRHIFPNLPNQGFLGTSFFGTTATWEEELWVKLQGWSLRAKIKDLNCLNSSPAFYPPLPILLRHGSRDHAHGKRGSTPRESHPRLGKNAEHLVGVFVVYLWLVLSDLLIFCFQLVTSSYTQKVQQ